MQLEEIKAYCLEKWKACEEYPFGEVPICYKLNRKIFAQIYPEPGDFKITLKCTADAGQFYRQVYPGIVVRGYHCPPVQQPYWNTIYPDQLLGEEVMNMIDHAYETVLHSFSKKVQKEIMTAGDLRIRPMAEGEYPLLEAFLYDAVFQPEGSELLPKDIIYRPELAIYIRDFGKPDDVCLVAEAEGKVLGAAWSRILAGTVRGYGNIDDTTPECAVSVKKEFRQQGIGTKLMVKLMARLKEMGYERVSLSVDKDNDAFRMYQKLGFEVVQEQAEDNLMLLVL